MNSDTGITLRISPETLAEQFFKLDEGDTDHLRELDILIDHPDVASVARMHFDAGTGYEVIWSGACEHDDYAAIISVIGQANVIHCAPHGYAASGYPQMRALYWERRTVFAF